MAALSLPALRHHWRRHAGAYMDGTEAEDGMRFGGAVSAVLLHDALRLAQPVYTTAAAPANTKHLGISRFRALQKTAFCQAAEGQTAIHASAAYRVGSELFQATPAACIRSGGPAKYRTCRLFLYILGASASGKTWHRYAALPSLPRTDCPAYGELAAGRAVPVGNSRRGNDHIAWTDGRTLLSTLLGVSSLAPCFVLAAAYAAGTASAPGAPSSCCRGPFRRYMATPISHHRLPLPALFHVAAFLLARTAFPCLKLARGSGASRRATTLRRCY